MTLIETLQADARSTRWAGIALVIAGLLALVAPFAAGVSITIVIGVLMLVSGIAQVLLVFKAGSIGRGVLLLLLGLLSLVAGGYSLTQPLAALAALTLILAAYFVATGILQIVAAFGARPAKGWGMILFSGIVSLLLGAMIWRQFPVSGVWAVGTLIGIQMLMYGWAMISIAGTAKEFVREQA